MPKYHSFVDERALVTITLISSCHWKTLVPFWLRKKRPENKFLTLIMNYCKIVQKNKLWHSNSNKLAIYMWCYLFIACFDWKIGNFQQTFVRVYNILKFLHGWFMLTILIKAYFVNVVVDVKPIYLNKHLFQNKICYLDKIYFCFTKIIKAF